MNPNARALLILLVVMAALAVPVKALAADSHAPQGARGDWLPRDEWVMSSWLPYDEARLYALLDTDRREVDAWLDDHRSLGALARRHGVHSLRALATRLVATRHVSRSRRRVLRARALDTLTQPHLARHVFFHIFHTPAVADGARGVFGVSPAGFRRLRNRGLSPIGIGAAGHRSAAHVVSALHGLFAARGRRAVRLGSMSTRQARALLAEQDADLEGYASRTFRTTAQQVDFVCAGGQASKVKPR
jgi:hypothetical protein